MASRTVSTAATVTFRLRYFHAYVPMLLVLWTMSPLGGQAALRVVSQGFAVHNQTSMFNYLDIAENEGDLDGADDASTMGTSVTAAFNGALISPSSSKNSSQDLYGNLKVPILESIIASSTPNASGWYEVSYETNQVYSALIGLPTSGFSSNGNSTFTVDTSYMYPNCSVRGDSNSGCSSTWMLDQSLLVLPNDSVNPWLSGSTELFLNWDLQHDFNSLSPLSLSFYSWDDADADSNSVILTNASCQLGQTNVSLLVSCINTDCGTTAIRESQPGQPISAPSLFKNRGSINLFFSFLLNATRNFYGYHDDMATPLEYYFVDPAAPFSSQTFETVPLYTLGDTVFSERFAQLLNTLWFANSAPTVVTGDFSATRNTTSRNYVVTRNSTGTIATGQVVLRCNVTWLVVLIVSSTTMFCAGMASAILGALRRGPDVLDAFTVALRDNRYCALPAGRSMDDGLDLAKQNVNVKVRLGDVRPDAEVGHAAIGAVTIEQTVARLRLLREYD
jgi:hypothetical protein